MATRGVKSAQGDLANRNLNKVSSEKALPNNQKLKKIINK